MNVMLLVYHGECLAWCRKRGSGQAHPVSVLPLPIRLWKKNQNLTSTVSRLLLGCFNAGVRTASLKHCMTQMEFFPVPDLGLCESLPDTPPTPNPAPPGTPVPAPVAPQPAPPAPPPAPAPTPVVPARVDADGPAKMIPKRAIEVHGPEGVSARSTYLDDASV